MLLPALTFQPSPPDPIRFPGDVALCAIAKNEAPYLLEWIAYHRVIGVEHILLFDNDSDDRTAEILAPLVAKGIIEHVPWPIRPNSPPQLPAYEEGLRRLRDRFGGLASLSSMNSSTLYKTSICPPCCDGTRGQPSW